MYVHNVYSDLLFYVSSVLNKILNNKIIEYKYNFGNATYLLSYNPNYELPNAIIQYISSNPFNARMNTFHRITKNNYIIPILYDKNKDIELLMQEDLYYIDISVLINTETQLKALEIKHTLENTLPVGKLLLFSSFSSFFELDNTFINDYLFDVNNDDIDNLFLKHNKITDEMDYCCSIKYEPYIRLESIDLSIADLSAATFQVACSVKLLTHLPSAIFLDKQKSIGYDSVHLLSYNNIIVPINDEFEYYFYKNNIIKLEKNENIQEIIVDNSTLLVEKEEEYIELGTYFDNRNNKGLIKIRHFKNNYTSISIDSKNIKEAVINNNKISGIIDNNIKLELYYEISRVIFNFKNNLKLKYIIPNDIFSVLFNINKFKAEINYEKTEILGFDDIILPVPIKLNNLGNFEFVYDNLYNISGNIELKTGKIYLHKIRDFNNLLTEVTNFKINYLKLNIIFNMFEIRGGGYIEKINFEFDFLNNPISIANIFNNNIVCSKNIKNIIISNIIFIENINNVVKFKINEFKKEYIDYSFHFLKYQLIINKENLNIKYDLINDYFITTANFYYKYLSDINNLNPLILKLEIEN
ncbi:MAG: hypothetical protein IPH62_19620 [Ignavibacteriae bacterium]|nr:hypothetical protein [Ignavibacteriota bacterium]